MDLPVHQLTMTVLMTPDTTNFSGKVHGGTILKRLDQVMFRQPIQVGELVSFLASVNHTGNSSMEVGIKVIAENIRAKVVRHVNSCFFTMITVDDAGRPTKVPPLAPQTPDERRRFTEAELRRAMRRETERKFAEVHGGE